MTAQKNTENIPGLCEKGVSLVEVIIVIGLLAIIVGMAVPIYRASYSKGDLDANVAQLLSTIRLAQSKAISGESASKFGVHVDTTSEPDKYILFKGDSFNPADSYNQEFELSSQISISSISLNGGSDDLVFNEYDGTTGTYGYIELRNISGEVQNITINNIGTTDVVY